MAEGCIDRDYLGAYSRFFSEFVARVKSYNQLPVSPSPYNVTDAEIVGEVVNVSLEYLNKMQCPSSFRAHLVHQVVQEIKSMCKKQPEDCGYRSRENTYTSLKLMQAITGKVNEICTRYLDNSRLILLPPPLSTPFPAMIGGGNRNGRRKMEDRFAVVHDLHTTFGIQDESIANYYAVFDGHAGQDAAVYAATHLHQYLVESIYYPTDPELALRDAFITTDTKFAEKSKTQKVCGGTTAVCILILNKKLYVAWVGDSTAMLIKRDSIVQLVNPHRLHREDEVRRVKAMGGVVMRSMGTMRVNGTLSISRAIGDLRYKPFVTAEPEIKSIPLDGTEDFLVLATDGLADHLEPKDILTVLYHEIHRPNGLYKAHEFLVHWAKRAGSRDNITELLVLLTPAEQIAARSQYVHPCLDWEVNDILDNMNSNDKTLFPDINDTHRAINSNIIKQTEPAQETRDHDPDDAILTASNGKHENGDADYDYSDLGPETDVDALDDAPAMPMKNLSYEFCAGDPALNEQDQQFDKDSNRLDNETLNANMNVNINLGHEPIVDNNVRKVRADEDDDDDDDDDDVDDDEEDEEDEDDHRDRDNRVPSDILTYQMVQDEVARREDEVRETLGDERADDETKHDDRTDDARDVVDEARPRDYDDLTTTPEANKPLQHALTHEADNVADSEDSEDEWNYYRVDPNKEKDTSTPVDEPQETENEEKNEIPEHSIEGTESKIQSEDIEAEIKCERPIEESPVLIKTEISAESGAEELEEEEEKLCKEEHENLKDMDFQLNPNAAEFIPVSPQFTGTRMNLVGDYPVSGSPYKQVPQMDDIQVPSQSEFEQEVCQRPREVESNAEEEEEKDYQNGEHLQSMSFREFMCQRQKAAGNLDDSEISSTKAEFGDESSASFLTASEFHRTQISTIDESFSSSERDYDIAKDPMAMSFTPSDFEAAFDKSVDLNAVHDLSNVHMIEENGEATEKDSDFLLLSSYSKSEEPNLMAAAEAEEPADKPDFLEQPAELVNLSLQQGDSESTFIEQADQFKTTSSDLLNLEPESSLAEQQETAKYDQHSPVTDNYSMEYESEREPISIDNEQPLSPSSADIDETKPIDEASDDVALPEHDLPKEACPNEADTPTSLSPVPDVMETDFVAAAESTGIDLSAPIQSTLHTDSPVFVPGQYSFCSYGMETSESVAETADVCKAALPMESSDACLLSAKNAGEETKDHAQNLIDYMKFDEREMKESLSYMKPSLQEDNLLDFAPTESVCAKPSLLQGELTPPLSPQEFKENTQNFDDSTCPIESSITFDRKVEESMKSNEVPEIAEAVKSKEDVIEDDIIEAMEDSIELANQVESITTPEPTESDERIKEPTLNLSESMQEFTGLESQLLPQHKEEEISETIAVVEVHKEEKTEREEPLEATESQKILEPVLDEVCKIEARNELFAHTQQPAVKEPELQEWKIDEPEEKESNVDEPEVQIPEIKEPEVKEPEATNIELKEEPQMEEVEVKEPEVKEVEIKEPEMEEPEVKELKLTETEIQEREMKKPEFVEPKMEEIKVNEPEVKETKVEEPEVIETEVQQPEIKEPEVKEPEVKEPEVKEAEIKEPEVKEVEIKEPEAKEFEIKEPEAKELEIKESETEKPSEVKESETEKPVEASESKVAAAATAAAAAITAVAATGAVAAQSKAKVKAAPAKTTKTPTSKAAATKSTPTSPSKTLTSTSRTSMTGVKKQTSAPARPKDLDAPKKSAVQSTTASKPLASKPATKTTSSTATTKPITKTTTGPSARAKSASTAAPKPAISDKKPTANGDVKSLSKTSTAAKPPSKTTTPVAKTTSQAKTTTTRTTTGSATAAKPKSTASATTVAARNSTAAKTNSATTLTPSSTLTARPKTAPAVANTAKTRSPLTKSPMIDKQVKETANKQISMARTSSTTASKTSRLSSNSATSTTVKRLSSVTKTTTVTSTSPTKKSTPVSKVSSKTPTGGKATSEKMKIVQNGVSENVKISAIIDDMPKKDLSPVVAPNDNQLIMSSD